MNLLIVKAKPGKSGQVRRAKGEKEGHEKAPRQRGSSNISDETYSTINMISSETAKVKKNKGFLRFFTANKDIKVRG